MKHSIVLRLLAFFAAALLLFAVVSSVLFGAQFTRLVTDTKREELLSRAATLSGMLSKALGDTRSGGMRMGGPGGGYSGFVRILSESDPNLWVLDEHLSFLSSGRMMGRTLEYSSLPPDAERLVRDVFEGRSSFSQGFSELAGVPTLTVGSPVYQDGRVVGALLLNDAVSGVDKAIAQGQRVLMYSAGAALLLALVLAVLLSLSFTRPISLMRAVAGRMAEGDYTARTQIARRDEIGQLAASIDTLSGRLAQARDQSDRQEQLRKDFFANVSHELRTPVTVLRGSLEALRDGVVTDPAQRDEYIDQMLKETWGLNRLVDDLMELSKLQNPDAPLESGELVFGEVLMDALRGAERLARPKGIVIRRGIPEEPLTMWGDYARLRQMLLIVLDNAIKFSPAGTTVSAVMDDSGITIADEGPGIPKEDLPYIFDRFHKSGSAHEGRGSGLGLAIARGIADRHGLTMTVESDEGKGTTVRFAWRERG